MRRFSTAFCWIMDWNDAGSDELIATSSEFEIQRFEISIGLNAKGSVNTSQLPTAFVLVVKVRPRDRAAAVAYPTLRRLSGRSLCDLFHSSCLYVLKVRNVSELRDAERSIRILLRTFSPDWKFHLCLSFTSGLGCGDLETSAQDSKLSFEQVIDHKSERTIRL